MTKAAAVRTFDGVAWAMAEFHKGERRAAALARRENARRREECRRLQREEKRMARAAAF